MKKFIKYLLYGTLYLIIIFILAILFIATAKADIIKPNMTIKPYEVVKIQLKSLKKNDLPSKDYGIKQTWEFAHPNNKKNTGPLERFKIMLKGQSYVMLLNHLEHEITQLKLTDLVALFEVRILDESKTYYKFSWQLEKYTKDGLLKDCWLTTAVSPPISLGSSI
jgi:hypothetical protein